MKIILLSLMLVLSISIYSQTSTDSALSNKDSIIRTEMPVSTITQDSLLKKESLDQMSRNLDGFLQAQKKRDEKAMRDSILRISFGVLMLVVLIIGLRRKKRGQKASSRD